MQTIESGVCGNWC